MLEQFLSKDLYYFDAQAHSTPWWRTDHTRKGSDKGMHKTGEPYSRKQETDILKIIPVQDSMGYNQLVFSTFSKVP